jgi:hypothetical protein
LYDVSECLDSMYDISNCFSLITARFLYLILRYICNVKGVRHICNVKGLTIVSLLLYCCFTAALRKCFSAACRLTAALLLLYCCFTAALLLLYCLTIQSHLCGEPLSRLPPYCCFTTAALLLLYYCFTAATSAEEPLSRLPPVAVPHQVRVSCSTRSSEAAVKQQ